MRLDNVHIQYLFAHIFLWADVHYNNTSYYSCIKYVLYLKIPTFIQHLLQKLINLTFELLPKPNALVTCNAVYKLNVDRTIDIYRRIHRGRWSAAIEAHEGRHIFRALRIHGQEKFGSDAVSERVNHADIRSRFNGSVGVPSTYTNLCFLIVKINWNHVACLGSHEDHERKSAKGRSLFRPSFIASSRKQRADRAQD